MSSYGAMQTSVLAWRKASFCQNRECVEVAEQNGRILMRNSARPDGLAIHYTTEEFRSFLKGVKAGEFDDLAR
jgi:hypothetical protein